MATRHVVSFVLLAALATTASAALKLPSSIRVEAEAPGGTVVGWTASVAGEDEDNAGRTTHPVTCSPASLSLFPLGTTTVSCSASEGSTGTFTVTVVDTTPPDLNLPLDMTVAATSTAGAAVAFSASADDIVDGQVAVTCTPTSGSTFPLGTTTVSCSASDSRSNSASGSFAIEVAASAPPPGPNPRDMVAEATEPGGATVYFTTGGGTDRNGRPSAKGCSPAPGSLFPFGTTTVHCPQFDFDVTVVDTTPPTLSLPADFVVDSSVPVAVDYNATFEDLVDGSGPATCFPQSGQVFALGVTTVQCYAEDSRGNVASGSFLVQVTDVHVFVPHDIVAEATGPDGALVDFDPAVGACFPASGSLFPLGKTAVTCETTSFNVEVVDTTEPEVTAPSDVTLEATSAAGAPFTYSTTATDIVDGTLTVDCAPASGMTFPPGVTRVECSAIDAHGNTGAAGFYVTVVDTTPPSLSLPADFTLHAVSAAGATGTYSASASDLVDGVVAISCAPPSGSTFPLGVTTVNCSAADARGNSATGSFAVTVIDVDPPVIASITATPAILWTPNRKLVDITLTVDATDAVDPTLLIQIYRITADENIAASDAVITGALTAKLRADRDGNGDGRVYTIEVEVIDDAGNRSVGSTTVKVPHDMGQGLARRIGH